MDLKVGLPLLLAALGACVQESEVPDAAGTGGRAASADGPVRAAGDDSGAGGGRAASAGTGRTVLARLPDSRESAAAAAVGTLRVRGGCVYLEESNGGLLLLGVTNPDIRWNSEDSAILVGGQRLRDNDRIRVGGAEVNGPARAALTWQAPPPDGCDLRRIWVTGSIEKAG
jgi:hypothetical protein